MTNEEYYAMLDRHHLCHGCHKEKAFQGRKFCPECLEKKATKNAKWREKQRASPELMQAERDRCRAWYHQHKDAGLCVRCGRPATHGLYCYEHSIRNKRRGQKQAEKDRRDALDRVNVNDYRRENHLCCYCGAPIEDGNPTRACNACRERFRSYLQKNNGWKQYGEFKFGKRLYEPINESRRREVRDEP